MQQIPRQGAPQWQGGRAIDGDDRGRNDQTGYVARDMQMTEAEQSTNGQSFPRSRKPMPSATSNGRGNPGAIGAAISRPAPMPQWPLTESGNSPVEEGESGRGPAPQRPPRPRYVPSLLDSSKIQEHTPTSFAYRSNQPTDESQDRQKETYEPSNMISSPLMTGSNRDSESSVGTIPDFPQIPTATVAPPRRNTNLGPPPARRGYSSHYSQTSYVSPIPEESPGVRSHGSYASSHVIPSSWGSGPPGYPVTQGLDMVSDYGREDGDGRGSRSPSNDDEESGLVRKASLGKRHKPSLTTIRSSKEQPMDDQYSNSSGSGKSKPGGVVGRGVVAAGATGATAAAGLGAPRQPQTQGSTFGADGGTGFLDASSSSSGSRGTSPHRGNGLSPTDSSRELSPLARELSRSISPVDPRITKILGGFGKGSFDASTPTGNRDPNKQSFSERVPGPRRPPRLNIDAVREAEARGSLTSLPDLIKRATKLAAVLEKGRPESRWGEYSTEGRDTSNGSQRHSGSISDILASFPPPVLAGPRNNHRASRAISRWPLPEDGFTPVGSRSIDVQSRDTKTSGRRCCGLPRWALVLLIIFAFVVIAAAVVVPLELVRLSKKQDKGGVATPNPDQLKCQQELQCQNGGTTVYNSNFCRCVCVNGFTGDRCTNPADNGCAVIDINSNNTALRNATIGSSIPRLLETSVKSYSIPLDSAKLLSLFSAINLSCSSENALVTFNGRPGRSSQSSMATVSSTPVPNGVVTKRQTPETIPSSILTAPATTASAMTTNGIIFDPSPAATVTRTASSPSATESLGVVTLSENVLDFARVCVLYILQQTSSFNIAANAQYRLQTTFTSGGDLSNVNAGNSIIVNFRSMTLDLGNGTAKVGSNNIAWR